VIVSGPGAPEILSKEAWRQGLLATLPQDIKLTLRFDTQEIEVSGDLAYERGTYAVEVRDPATNAAQPLLSGRHIHIFKRDADGSWKGWRLMENSPDPATAPKMPGQWQREHGLRPEGFPVTYADVSSMRVRIRQRPNSGTNSPS
jgi:ketosteroid isomerase-like protein